MAKKRIGPPASHLKVLIWEAQVDVFVCRGMLDNPKKDLGNQEPGTNRIIISPDIESMHELLDTFVHEVLHFVLGTDEELVEACTAKIIHSLTGFERKRLFLKFAQSLKKVEG